MGVTENWKIAHKKNLTAVKPSLLNVLYLLAKPKNKGEILGPLKLQPILIIFTELEILIGLVWTKQFIFQYAA